MSFDHLRTDVKNALTQREERNKKFYKEFLSSQNLSEKDFEKQVKEGNIMLQLELERFYSSNSLKHISRPENLTFQSVEIDGIACEWILPPNPRSDIILLYFHGGGYIMGSISDSWQKPAYLATHANIKVLNIDYRLAPEYPFPAALNDSFTVYSNLSMSKEKNPPKIYLAGISAGGGLALSLALKLRDENLPLPAGLLLMSPWTDLTCSSQSHLRNKELDPTLKTEELKTIAAAYIGSDLAKNPLISPRFGDFSGLPPMLIDVGSLEILFDDSFMIARKAMKQGTAVQFKNWEGMFHGFHSFIDILPEANKALDRMVSFLYAGDSTSMG